jgi:flavin-dependent dehydrogenase
VSADAIVVGARCAGAATAIALARAGRRVVAVDRARFPSDTLSTHLLFAGGVAELARLGALERVEATGAPRMPEALMAAGGMEVRARYTPVGGVDYGLCVRRTGLDAALVETARAAGAEVREQTAVTGVLWEDGRAAGVRVRDASGRETELRSPLIVGADGRRSRVAAQAGVQRPRRSSANGRACYFAYWADAREDRRHIAAQWREGRELGTAFPCDGGLVLVLLMPPVERAEDFRADLTGAYERTVAAIPGLAERLAGCTRETKIRQATETTSYFRRSAGQGWALPGDAGHFKDPVTAQGIRDALRFGRRLGEMAAPVLGDPVALDRALAAWERERDYECLETYQWTNELGRADSLSPIEAELYRAASTDPALADAMLDVFARTRRPTAVLTARRGARLARAALARPGADRRAVARDAVRRAASAGREAVDRMVAHRPQVLDRIRAVGPPAVGVRGADAQPPQRRGDAEVGGDERVAVP